jgi:hypothetical protein
MFWIFNDGTGYFWWLRDSWDGREERGNQPGHIFLRWRAHPMQPG